MAEFDLEGFKGAKKEFDLQGFKASKNPDMPVPSTHRRIDDFEGRTGQAAVDVKSKPKAESQKTTIPEKPSLPQSIGRGAAQGATLKFGDEINGAVQTIGNRILPVSMGGRDSSESQPSLTEDYRNERNAERTQNKTSEEAHPIGYLGGEVLGGLSTTAPLATAKGIHSIIAAGAGLGGIGAMGASKAEIDAPPTDTTMANDVALGTGAGALTSLGGYGISKGLGLLGRKIADSARGIGELFGREPAVNLDRAAATLGAQVGKPSADPLIKDALESASIDRLAPSTFVEASKKAPDALSKIASEPRIKVAEDAGKFGFKEALKSGPDDEALLRELAARKLPSGGFLSNLLSGATRQLGPVGRAIQDVAAADNANLTRALADPAKARELALLLAAGRAPNLAADTAKALVSRATALLANPD